jgi:glycosyltransferase involved in cell wall biosynthesis
MVHSPLLQITSRPACAASKRFAAPLGPGGKSGMIDFSVVIPTYRRPKELGEAIASVRRQSGVSFEILVVDDSPEGSAESVIRALSDPRVNYRKTPEPTGGVPSVVRNLAWPDAKGQFVHFLDDDDVVPDGQYAAVRAAFDTYPKVGLVFGRVEPFGSCAPEQLEHERRYFAMAARHAKSSSLFGTRFAFASQMLFGPIMLVCSAGVVRRESLEKVGGFDPQIRLYEDTDFYVRIMRECGACFLDRVGLHYRIGPSLMHPLNPSSEEQRRLKSQGWKLMQQKYRKDRGKLEFYALGIFARTMQKIL